MDRKSRSVGFGKRRKKNRTESVSAVRPWCPQGWRPVQQLTPRCRRGVPRGTGRRRGRVPRGNDGRPRVGTGAEVLLREGISCEREKHDIKSGCGSKRDVGRENRKQGIEASKRTLLTLAYNKPNINFRMSFTATYRLRLQIISDSKKTSTNGEMT